LSYFCKFDYLCKKTGKFNPVDTIPVTIRGINGQPKTILKTNKCAHGGGSGCPTWRHYTDREIGWYRPLPGRNLKPKILKYQIEVPHK
jgi:hypothetical protein